jgi:hypothetical protein
MEDNVQKLLEAEREVNKKVQAAIKSKNDLLKTVKEKAEANVA